MRVIAAIAVFVGWFALAHVIYWFITLDWIWLDQWSAYGRASNLAIASYLAGIAAFARRATPDMEKVKP